MAQAGDFLIRTLSEPELIDWLTTRLRPVMHPFRSPGSCVEVADDFLLRHRFRIEHHPAVSLDAPIQWNEDPLNDRNWQIGFHSLIPVSYLTQAFDATGQAAYLVRARDMVESWITAHIEQSREHPMTWHDHAIALRALVLLEFAESWRSVNRNDMAFAGRLLIALHLHAQRLTDPEVYRPRHNHGFEQDRALLATAILVPQWPESDVWRQFAWTRLMEQTRAGISADGAHFEQSPQYEGSIFLILAQTRDFLAAHEMPHEELDRATNMLLRKLAFAIRPDGTWPAIGDSTPVQAESLRCHLEDQPGLSGEALYAVTGGEKGTAPGSNHLILPSSGCAIFRERWDRNRLRDSLHCYFTATFNTRTHKHHDDLSFSLFAHGREILTDAGRHSYNYDHPHRRYCESVYGHNVVIVDSSDTDTRRLNIGKSGIISAFSGKNVVGVDAVHYLYSGIETRRLLLYFPPNVILVFDRVIGGRDFTATQQFLFATDWRVETVAGDAGGIRAVTSEMGAAGPAVRMLQLLPGCSTPVVHRGQSDPLIGWVSRHHGTLEPAHAVHTEANGPSAAFVTAFVIEPPGQSRQIGGRAQWDGQALRCTLHHGGQPIEFVFQLDLNRSRLMCTDALYESRVWPTPFEYAHRRPLSRYFVGATASSDADDAATSASTESFASSGTTERLNTIIAQVDQIEAGQRHTLELLNHDLAELQGSVHAIQDRISGHASKRIEFLERALAQSSDRIEFLGRRLQRIERAEFQLREKLSRSLRLVTDYRESGIRHKTDIETWRKRSLQLQKSIDDLQLKLTRAKQSIRVERQRFLHAQDRLLDTMGSVRWRIGDAIIRALRPSLDTLKLPVRLLLLFRDGLRRRGERQQRELAGLEAVALPALESAGDTAERRALSERARATVQAARSLAPPPRRDVRVACILDEFSHECFEPEADWRQLTPDAWRAEMDEHNPALLLVESAWRGKEEKWRHLVSTDRRDGDGPLRDLIDYCKGRGIPTVFWNKEDPANYDHFIQSAVWFDHILTTDSDCIERYEAAAGHRRCGVLPFAAQPRIHNPIGRRGGDLGNICFAGTWYASKHDGRLEDAQIVLEPALSLGLHIYDRMFGYRGPGWHNYLYPPEYQASIRGGLPYEEMLDAYKRYHIFLNVNSVRTSPTMCSRRVFEILACGTNVVSAYAPAIENLLGPDCVFLARNREDTKQYLDALIGDEALRNRTSVRALQRVMTHHTYAHRFAELLDRLGLRGLDGPPVITMLLPISNRAEVARLRDLLARTTTLTVEPIWLTTDSTLVVDAPGQVIHVDGSSAAAHARAIDQATGEYVYVVQRGTIPSVEVLSDLVAAFAYFGGDAVCKPMDVAANQLIFAETTAAPLYRTLFRRTCLSRLGGEALTSEAAFTDALKRAGLRVLATDSVEPMDVRSAPPTDAASVNNEHPEENMAADQRGDRETIRPNSTEDVQPLAQGERPLDVDASQSTIDETREAAREASPATAAASQHTRATKRAPVEIPAPHVAPVETVQPARPPPHSHPHLID